MLAHTHALTGAVSWLAAAPLITDTAPGLAIGAAVAAGAALAPDLDHRSGTATHAWGPITRTVGFLIGKLTGGHRGGTHSLLAIPVAGILTWLAVDRAGGWPAVAVVALCASLAFIACEDLIPGRLERFWPINLVCSVIAGLMAVETTADMSWLPWAVGVGWAAHIAGDSVTRGGCPLLLPFSGKRFAFTNARTGGTWETVTAWALTFVLGGIAAATATYAPDPWTTGWQRPEAPAPQVRDEAAG